MSLDSKETTTREVELELTDTWPHGQLSQVRAIKHFVYYMNCLNEDGDPKRSARRTMIKFKISKVTLVRHLAFARAYKKALDNLDNS